MGLYSYLLPCNYFFTIGFVILSIDFFLGSICAFENIDSENRMKGGFSKIASKTSDSLVERYCSISCNESVQVGMAECGESVDELVSLCLPYMNTTLTQTDIPPLRPPITRVQTMPIPHNSTFVADEWEPCSVSCGEGVRKRQVHCLANNKCSGPKPSETENCYMEACTSKGMDVKHDPYRHEIRESSLRYRYSWMKREYTECSATCLGGVQELIVSCVRNDTKKVVSPYLCPRDQKPEVVLQTCNDVPCPPKWSISDFGPCTQSCGIGIQIRKVNCIHKVSQDLTVEVPNLMCPRPPPQNHQHCNILDCPVVWKVSEWSKCSKPCDSGEKTRKVRCQQVMAQNHTIDKPISMCTTPNPYNKKPCNIKSCVLKSDRLDIDVLNTTYIQHNVNKKIAFLKVGGTASVFYGTVVQIKCAVEKFDITKVRWTKNHFPLPKTKKFRICRNGALRIQNAQYLDEGVYTCIAGESSTDITLSVQPEPDEFMNSEEISRQHGLKNEGTRDYDLTSTQSILKNDDHSHEQTLEYESVKIRENPPSSGSRTMSYFPQLIPNLLVELLTVTICYCYFSHYLQFPYTN